MATPVWRPILSGEALASAREALTDITASLAAGASPRAREDWSPELVRARAATLSDGFAGQALYCGYLHQAGGGRQAADLGLALLNRAIETAGAERMPPGLYGGFSGIAWVANHLAGRLYEPDEDDPYEETDGVLHDYARHARWPFQYELLNGLVGIGVYALERLPRASGRQCLETIVDRLAEVAQRGRDGITWLTPSAFVGEHRLEQAPQGGYYLGMAHGVPGVVSLLAALWAADVARDRVGPLLEGAVSWLLAQSLPAGSLSRFPLWWSAETKPTPSRLAWCYGDPGVAASLLWAAAALERDDWRREGLATALAAARRPLATSGVRDAGLCHGSAGVAHIFNRLYQATGEEELGRAALFWYEQLLAARTPGEGHGGYMFERIGADGAFRVSDPGFLNGTVGVGLVLLAATTAVEPAWDRALLTSVPPRACG